MNRRELPLLGDANAREIIDGLCKEHDISLDLVVQLLDIQRDYLGSGRKKGITEDFSATLSEFIEEQEEAR